MPHGIQIVVESDCAIISFTLSGLASKFLNMKLEEISRSTVSVDQIKSSKQIQDKQDACPTSTTSKTA